MTAHDLASRRRDELGRVADALRAARGSAPRLGPASAVSVESDPAGVVVAVGADALVSLMVRPDWRGQVTEAGLADLVVTTVHTAQAAHAGTRLAQEGSATTATDSPYAPEMRRVGAREDVPTRADLEQVLRREGPLALVRMIEKTIPAPPVEEVVTSADGHAEAVHRGGTLVALELDRGWLAQASAAELTREIGEVLVHPTSGGPSWT